MNSTPPEVNDSSVSANRYLVLVGGLLVFIVALLAVLWVQERSRRIAAEVEIKRLQQQAARQDAFQTLMHNKLGGLRIDPVRREGLPPEKSNFNGKPATAPATKPGAIP